MDVSLKAARFSYERNRQPTKTSGYRVYCFAMVKNAQFSLVSIERGSKACATELAIRTRIVAIEAAIETRITKRSIKTITIR